jgi:hypothetical protein
VGLPHCGLVWPGDADGSIVTAPAEMRIVESLLQSAAPHPRWLPTDPTPLTRLTEPPPRITLSARRVRPPGSWLRVVERRRLLDRVSQAVADAPLTLISAPAGYGKTVLASEWAGSRASHQRPSAWLTISDRDNQPGVFWCHVFFALAFVGGRSRRCAASDGLHRSRCR